MLQLGVRQCRSRDDRLQLLGNLNLQFMLQLPESQIPNLVRIVECSADLTQISKIGQGRCARNIDNSAHDSAHCFPILLLESCVEPNEKVLEVVPSFRENPFEVRT